MKPIIDDRSRALLEKARAHLPEDRLADFDRIVEGEHDDPMGVVAFSVPDVGLDPEVVAQILEVVVELDYASLLYLLMASIDSGLERVAVQGPDGTWGPGDDLAAFQDVYSKLVGLARLLRTALAQAEAAADHLDTLVASGEVPALVDVDPDAVEGLAAQLDDIKVEGGSVHTGANTAVLYFGALPGEQ